MSKPSKVGVDNVEDLPLQMMNSEPSNSGNSSSAPPWTVAKKRGNNRKTVVTKEYNLHDKPLAINSPIHENTFVIISLQIRMLWPP